MNGASTSPQITFWTNHGCPWAQRVQIVLRELGLPYEEVIIDLDRPREEWYLKINPRGTVPSIRYSNSSGSIKEEIITESAIIAQFLADAHPSHLLPASGDSATAPLSRARVSFFADTYVAKVQPVWMSIAKEASRDERERKGDELVAVVEREMEPLLVLGERVLGLGALARISGAARG
ncbi:hypothetical protein GJ744_001726 [Endocarpon pusillum]|uniref:GST N-terminal domain-containing protein n=1 Tax=Endocarpon pusillum TaxID=364733 RepID=A0A8H7E1M9_9EURO|nr:hypothetical protein GJ744_001726 [Endocarpon pusillum]